MSTYMERADKVTRKWYILDAAGKPMGRTATVAANILRGKHKVTFTPHVDCGDFVIILNADKAVLTGNKLDQKYHHRHSGWPGGLKSTKYRVIMDTRPEFAMNLAVRGMLQKNTIARAQLKRLKVYSGEEHKHQAQMPEVWSAEQGR